MTLPKKPALWIPEKEVVARYNYCRQTLIARAKAGLIERKVNRKGRKPVYLESSLKNL